MNNINNGAAETQAQRRAAASLEPKVRSELRLISTARLAAAAEIPFHRLSIPGDNDDSRGALSLLWLGGGDYQVIPTSAEAILG